ncbi:diacylglycerol kinase [Aciduliprofundum sp. MAR08-339]|uniref:diacylglycerol kinase n=1 Tax=Aciduliprofundum sp. (strain MAR08-339) TaxID=673860 RepID=UPI0002A496BF|nr:diacylglycerol kinase [Aciduliprofundum sp. MAR08-339]
MGRFLRALHHALDGIGFAFTSERSLRIQFGIFLIVLVFGLYFQISADEFALIIGISALVFGLELINTAIEKSMDILSNGRYDERIRVVKDVSAGAVLVAAAFAVSIGVLIFLPKIMGLLK